MKEKKDHVVYDETNYIEQDETLPLAIIVDIDGTIALIHGRSPFDATKWDTDKPHSPIILLITAAMFGVESALDAEVKIIFITGREGGSENKEATLAWINAHTPFVNHSNYELHMREEGDTRGDVIVKQELYDEHIKDKYKVLWVFEDRNKMVNFWRNEIRLPTLQVKDGDY